MVYMSSDFLMVVRWPGSIKSWYTSLTNIWETDERSVDMTHKHALIS